jgi:hypothetical protein
MKAKVSKVKDYKSLFIKQSYETARTGKTVYVRGEFHERIRKIVQTIGGNEVSIFSYIDNIIAHHFETYRDDIVKSYSQNNDKSIF